MIANSVKISVFCKEEENCEKIKKKLTEIIPLDMEAEKIFIGRQKATGFDEKAIEIFEICLEKNKHADMFIRSIAGKLGEEAKERIIQQAESRLDAECNFFLRFSKEKLLEENDLWLTDQGNCFHIKINIAAFPKKRENALEIIRKVFKPEE